MDLKIEKISKSECIIYLEGKIDLKNLEIFKEKVYELERENFKTLILDFKSLTFINSVSIGAILGIDMHLKTSGRELKIRNIPDEVYSILKFSNLEKKLTIL